MKTRVYPLETPCIAGITAVHWRSNLRGRDLDELDARGLRLVNVMLNYQQSESSHK